MNGVAAMNMGAGQLQFAEVTGVIKRKGSKILELRVFTQFESDEHRAEREAAGIALPAPTFTPPPVSLFRKLAKLVGIGALLLSVAHAHPEIAWAATVITNAGQAIVTNLVSGTGGTVPNFVAWGTGAGTAGVTDTTLFTETTDETRVTGTKSRVTTTVTNDTYQVVSTNTVATAGKTITNVGIFDASTTGNLYFKSDFTGLALLVGDSITFTLKIKYS